MAGIPNDKLEKMVGRWNAIQAELNAGVNQAAYAKLTKEFAALTPLVTTIEALRSADRERQDLTALIADPTSDKEMNIAMARADLEALEPRREELESRLKSSCCRRTRRTSGARSSKFAPAPAAMRRPVRGRSVPHVQRYAELRGWKVEIISMSENDLGGSRKSSPRSLAKGFSRG